MKRNIGLVAILALVLGVASAFTTSSKTASLALCDQAFVTDNCDVFDNIVCCTADEDLTGFNEFGIQETILQGNAVYGKPE
jgi:hypothetical protein